jgi:hypothetical protein
VTSDSVGLNCPLCLKERLRSTVQKRRGDHVRELDGVQQLVRELVCSRGHVYFSPLPTTRIRVTRRRVEEVDNKTKLDSGDELDKEWSAEGAERMLAILVKPLPAHLRGIKFEEWCAELAAIDSWWEKTVYLIDLVSDLYKVVRAAREGNKERA